MKFSMNIFRRFASAGAALMAAALLAVPAAAQETVCARVKIEIKQEPGALMNVRAGANLADVVKALNALGANPQDLIAILQAMRAAGSLRAELEVI